MRKASEEEGDLLDPQFLYQRAYALAQTLPHTGLAKVLDLKAEAEASLLFDFSAVQESLRFRLLRRARLFAFFLIDDKGEVSLEAVHKGIALVEKEGFIFYAEGMGDALFTEHALRVLHQLTSKATLKILYQFQRPLCHSWAEDLVRQTLSLKPQHPLTQAEIRRAVLTACLTPLRQTVGSCFATAPAILIQREQMLSLLEDLYQLLSTGKLKRTFGGVEYAVPLSPSTGIGDLRRRIGADEEHAQLWLSPGLRAAFEAGGILEEGLSEEHIHGQLKNILSPYLAQKAPLTIEQLIHHVLLHHFRLTEEDLSSAEQFENAQFKSAKLSSLIPHRGASHKVRAAQELKRKEKLARAAFKGVCDPALLKAWEFTIASFSEVKMEFSRWNLYASLGLHHEEEGGIGEMIFRHLEDQLQTTNEKIQELQKEYELAFDQLRATEILLKQASTEAEIRRLQAEYRSRGYHMQMCIEMRDAHYTQGSHYSTLYPFLVERYAEKFPEYFQEIYDAEMQDVQEDLYADSPAGFRLVYKHGRNDPSQWTLIYDEEHYLQALVSFFSATESEIAAACEWEGGEREILTLTGAIIRHVRTPLFLETALLRMSRAHQKLPQGSMGKKPWVYLSGGTMTTLLKTYYRREGELTLEARWVESESELVIFLLDVLKNLPPAVTDPYLKKPHKGMLITSPTHAFILHPGWELFRAGWQEETFTYTWVRDQIFLPSQKFYAEMQFGIEEQTFLVEELCRGLPPLLAHHMQRRFAAQESPVTVGEWRQAVWDILLTETHKGPFIDEIDAFLYQSLPLIKGKEWKIVLRRLLSDRKDEKVERALTALSDFPAPFLSAKKVREIAKALYLRAHPHLCLSFDLHQHIADHARFIGLAQPTPFLFADTNWGPYVFGCVVNPGTSRMELWRLDRTGLEGRPMSSWKHWLNGIDKKLWTLYVKPTEYGA